jgi:hypothetical protein
MSSPFNRATVHESPPNRETFARACPECAISHEPHKFLLALEQPLKASFSLYWALTTLVVRRAGVSERQIKAAMRVTNVPTGQFEQAVESDKPLIVTALAEMGTRSQSAEAAALTPFPPIHCESILRASLVMNTVGQLCSVSSSV